MRTLYFFFDFATLNRSADHRAWALLRRARAAGLQITGVVGAAEYGEPSAFRRAVDRLRLPYALGIRKTAISEFPKGRKYLISLSFRGK